MHDNIQCTYVLIATLEHKLSSVINTIVREKIYFPERILFYNRWLIPNSWAKRRRRKEEEKEEEV